MSTGSNTSIDDMKRIPMACTRCRGMKLKCRVPEGKSRCSRCISQNKDCLFIPVSSEQPPTPNPSAPYFQAQFRLQPPMNSNRFPPPTQSTTSAQQPTTLAQQPWNDAHTTALYPNYVTPGHQHSYDRSGNRYERFTNLQLAQQAQSGIPTGSTVPMQMNYPTQGVFPNSQMNTTGGQGAVNYAFDPTFSQYMQSSPNDTTWPPSTMYTDMALEESQYYPFYNPQGQTD